MSEKLVKGLDKQIKSLVEKCEDYGYFYDDYADNTIGDAIFENLFEFDKLLPRDRRA